MNFDVNGVFFGIPFHTEEKVSLSVFSLRKILISSSPLGARPRREN